jgi:hypothetical protein
MNLLHGRGVRHSSIRRRSLDDTSQSWSISFHPACWLRLVWSFIVFVGTEPLIQVLHQLAAA